VQGLFLLLVVEEPEDDDNTPSNSLTDPELILVNDEHNDLSSVQINFNALSNLLTPKALCLLDIIFKKSVIVLVDGGSTHNFIQGRVVKFVNLLMQPTPTLKVMVGNGSVIECHQFCPTVPIPYRATFFLLILMFYPLVGRMWCWASNGLNPWAQL